MQRVSEIYSQRVIKLWHLQEPGEDTPRDEVQYVQKRSRQQDEAQRTLGEIRYTLFDNRNGYLVVACVAFAVARLCGVWFQFLLQVWHPHGGQPRAYPI